jgi:hypothetical protein
MSIPRRSLIMVIASLPLAGQLPDLPDPIRAVLDKRFPTQLVRDEPALAFGALLFALEEMGGNLRELSFDKGAALFRASLANGNTATWRCDQPSPRNVPFTNPFLNGVNRAGGRAGAECIFDAGTVPERYTVVVDRSGERVSVRAKAGGYPGNEPTMFIGTDMPKFVPSWAPVIAPEYVERVHQASLLPPMSESQDSKVRAFSFGRYVFDSKYSVNELGMHIQNGLESRGFTPGLKFQGGEGAAFSFTDGLLRIARIATTALPGGMSRCDLMFVQAKQR